MIPRSSNSHSCLAVQLCKAGSWNFKDIGIPVQVKELSGTWCSWFHLSLISSVEQKTVCSGKPLSSIAHSDSQVFYSPNYCTAEQYLQNILQQCATSFWNFRQLLSGCSALDKSWQNITNLSIYYRDMTWYVNIFVNILSRYDLACTWKNRVLGQNIAISFGSNGAPLGAMMVHSARHIVLLLASFDVALPSERKNPSWIDWTIKISPSMRWVLHCRFPARRSRFRVSHHAT